jgi:Asp-tRNA(Asn)/Glu-tRNA(Gln) amidotransferase C subunit
VRELLETARAERDEDKVGQTAKKMSDVMERMEQHQAELLERVGSTMTDNLARHIQAAAEHAQDVAGIFDKGVDQIVGEVGKINAILEEFKNGFIPLADVVKVLQELVNKVTQNTEASLAAVQTIKANREYDWEGRASVEALSPRVAGPNITPSAADAAKRFDATPEPGSM